MATAAALAAMTEVEAAAQSPSFYSSPCTRDLDFLVVSFQPLVRRHDDADITFGDHPNRFGGHKTIQNNRALEAAFKRAGLTDISSHNLTQMCAVGSNTLSSDILTGLSFNFTVAKSSGL